MVDGSADTIAKLGLRPDAIARQFLESMERRDLDAARALLAEGFVMTFPGGRRFTNFEELLAFARPRYRSVRKRIDAFETVGTDDGAIVWCRGTLEGEWPDGRPFSGIRFVDRFVVIDGRLTQQDVWNDMAELRP